MFLLYPDVELLHAGVATGLVEILSSVEGPGYFHNSAALVCLYPHLQIQQNHAIIQPHKTVSVKIKFS